MSGSAWVRSEADERAVAAGCKFDEAAAERVRRFFAKMLRHTVGLRAGSAFELAEWQWREVIGPLFGWKWPDGTRRYRAGSVWVPKKNGKSTLAAGLVLYGMLADGERRARVYGAAADRSQARIIFDECASMVAESPSLRRRVDVIRSAGRMVAPDGEYAVLSKDAGKTGHGLHASLVVIDELHVVDRELYATLRHGGAARSQPLLVEISTAGTDLASLGYERYSYAKKLLTGAVVDLRTLAVVYELPGEMDWTRPESWRVANPSLGITISEEGFAADAATAAADGAGAIATFRQLRLNQWLRGGAAWIPIDQWRACEGPRPTDLQRRPLWIGVDLASRADLTAVCALWQLDGGRWWAEWTYLAPEEADERRGAEQKLLYRPWIDAGAVVATAGDITDYAAVADTIREYSRQGELRAVAFDPWNAAGCYQTLQDEGLPVVEVPQTGSRLDPAIEEVERLVAGHKLGHTGDPVSAWCLSNVVLHVDRSGRRRLDKRRSADKIDGAAALVTGMVAAQSPDAGTITQSIL